MFSSTANHIGFRRATVFLKNSHPTIKPGRFITEDKPSAFSLVELLVAMAIIAVLIAIAVYGFNLIQRNARNTQRRKADENLELAINDVESSSLKQAGWVSYDPSTKELLVSVSQGDAPVSKVKIQGFNKVVMTTSTLCSENKDGNGYGTSETIKDQIWLCYNPTTLAHGVRIESGLSAGAAIKSLGKPILAMAGKVNYGSFAQLSPQNLTDGNLGTNIVVQTNYGTSAVIDLQGKENISTINYSLFWDSRGQYFNQQANIQFYTSTDNVNWTAHPVQTIKNGGGNWDYALPQNTDARYVKFAWQNPPGGGWNGWGTIREISVK